MSFVTRRRLMYAILCLVYQIVFMQAVVMTTVANDVMRELDLTPAGMGALGSAYLYVYAVTMLLSGMFSAWFGPRRTLSFLFLVSGAGCLLFSRAESLEAAMIGRALCGMGLAACMTAGFTLFGRWYPPADFARTCSFFFASGGLGTVIGIGIMAPLNAAWGWRALFLLAGILTLAYAAALFLIVRDWPPDEAAALIGGERRQPEAVGLGILWRALREVARRVDFWRILVWYVFQGGVYFSLCGLWAVPYLKDVYGMSHGEAGGIVSLVTIGFVLGTPLVSAFSDKVLKSYRVAPGVAGIVVFAGVAWLLRNIDSMSGFGLAVLMTVLGLALNSPNGCLYPAARNLFGSRVTGIVGGVFGCVGFFAGAVMQMVCGGILKYGEGLGWSAPDRYFAAFLPFLAGGLVQAVAAFTLSKESFKS